MSLRFEDYHRTVIGFHGTKLSVALNIVQRHGSFKYSRNRDDWLGHGIYFWEYAPAQALAWAERRSQRQGWDEPVAVLASMIRLGFCFDLLDPFNVEYLCQLHASYAEAEEAAGRTLPRNANHRKFLDCAVFEYAYTAHEREHHRLIDTSRAVYVPSGGDHRIWERSWISKGSHIQICVRNTACIMGTWLHSTQGSLNHG